MQLAIRDSGAITLGNMRFEQNRLIIDGELQQDQMVSALEFLTMAQDCILFWWGDLGNRIKVERGEEAAKVAAQNTHNPDKILDFMKVLESLGGQRFKLSAEHHSEAYAECYGCVADSIEALEWAEKNRQDVPAMRWYIRQKRKTVETPEKRQTPIKTCYSEMHRLQSRFQAILEERPVSEWSAEEVMSVNADLDELLAVVEPIRQRFDEINTNLPGMEEK